jgi:hypothetical protein
VRRPEARGLFDGRWRGPHFILTHAPCRHPVKS